MYNGIVNNPTKTIVIPNVTINEAVNIVNRLINNNSYKFISVDNSMNAANIWQCTYNSKIRGLIDTMIVATFSFVEVSNGLQLTIECGKGVGAISDQWELQDCNSFITEAIQIAINPNVNNSVMSAEESSTNLAIGIVAVVCFIAFLVFIFV